MTKKISHSIFLAVFFSLLVLLLGGGLVVCLVLIGQPIVVSEVLPQLIGYLLLVLGLALLVAWLLSAGLSRRIAATLQTSESDITYKELKPLLRQIDMQKQQLRTQSWTLQQKQSQWDAVADSMSEGLVLLSSSCVILNVNTAARRLLGLAPDCVGSDILSYSKNLSDLLLTALSGKRAEKLLPLAGGAYQVDASPVLSEDMVSGVVLLLFDVTEKHKAEQQRREFTANFSHELKTPLHTISGYAELLSHGMVQPEDAPGFSRQIYDEAQRMIRLVEDIIGLSRLDEGMTGTEAEDVELLQLAQEILHSLKPEAELAQVTTQLHGSPITIRSYPLLLKGIVRNLCDNAIKYNRPGGKVTVTLGTEGGHPWICVEDTGIGIPRKYHQRIFERFYRVDKSHSKAVGGTGLGLSIVKHAAITLGAQLELDSEPGVGTTITLHLPR